MKLENNTILITGGSTGIGFALAEYFAAKNKVIICGRNTINLDEAKKKIPSLHSYVCDLSKKQEREGFVEWIGKNHSDLNILINNAGLQKRIDIKEWHYSSDIDDEIDINLKAPIFLSLSLLPILSKKEHSAIINVSSGLAFIPLAMFPVYCATKAAIHSFTMSLRHQLRDMKIAVIELIPPMVHDTYLKGKPIERTWNSISTKELVEETVNCLKEDKLEIQIGMAKNIIKNSRENIENAFNDMNRQ